MSNSRRIASDVIRNCIHQKWFSVMVDLIYYEWTMEHLKILQLIFLQLKFLPSLGKWCLYLTQFLHVLGFYFHLLSVGIWWYLLCCFVCQYDILELLACRLIMKQRMFRLWHLDNLALAMQLLHPVMVILSLIQFELPTHTILCLISLHTFPIFPKRPTTTSQER